MVPLGPLARCDLPSPRAVVAEPPKSAGSLLIDEYVIMSFITLSFARLARAWRWRNCGISPSSLDKYEAVRRQIECAIRLVAAEEDEAAIHTLVMAAYGVI